MQLVDIPPDRVRDRVDDPAVLDDVMPVGEGRGKAEILLDQQDREPLLLSASRMTAPICCTMTGARPSVGSSSSSRSRRCAGCGRSPASAARRPRAWCPGCAAARQVRKDRVDLVDAHAARPHHRRQQQILLDIEAGEDAALLRAIADPEPGDPVGGQADQFVAAKTHRALPLPHDAHDRAQRRRLAGAVAAEQRHQFALGDRELMPCRTWDSPYQAFRSCDLEQLDAIVGRRPQAWPVPI